MKKSANLAVLTAIALIAASAPAHAYLDPGTGSMILQGVIGGIAGGLFIARTYWAKMLSFLPGGRKKENASDDDVETDAGSRD